VGRLLDELDRLKLANDTIVLFLTDNGGTAGVKQFNAGMRGGKTSVHEGGCRVPLFVRWPGHLAKPHVVPQIAAHIDILPTLLDLCGIASPSEVKFDGCSLRLLLEGKADDWPERTLFTHNPITETNRYPGAVRTQKYRLVRELRGPGGQGGSKAKADRPPTGWQLFDMQSDPGQTKDLAAELPDVVSDLSRQYESWLDDVSASGLRRFPIQIGHAEENPVTLHAPQAYFDGSLKFHAGPGYAHDWLTNWTDAASKVWFDVEAARAGEYDVSLRYTCPTADAGSTTLRVSLGGVTHDVKVPGFEPKNMRLPHRDEAGHNTYVNREWGVLPVGRFKLDRGPAKLLVEANSKPPATVMDLKGVEITAAE
jgi:arylsulfatase A